MTPLRIGSLFSGIGGLELGLEWSGVGHTVWQVEISHWCRSILERHWPNVTRYEDVCTIDTADLAPADIVCGGFPCQDVSVANPGGAGLRGLRSGLWREFVRVLDGVRPKYVIIENVPGLVRRGLDVVVENLVDLGYEVAGTRVQAADFGAPHKRERLLLVAALADRAQVGREAARGVAAEGSRAIPVGGGPSALADTDGVRQRLGGDAGEEFATADRSGAGMSEPRLGRVVDELPAWLDVRWPAGRGEPQLDHEPPRTIERAPRGPKPTPIAERGRRWERARRVAGLGNAAVPWLGFIAGRLILEMEQRDEGV